MSTWEQVLEHVNELKDDASDEAQEITALIELCLEFENGGLTQYLMNSAGDSLHLVGQSFRRVGFVEGVAWLNAVDRVYGGRVPTDRDSRIERISRMPGFDEGIDPFDEGHAMFDKLLPYVESLTRSLFDQWKVGKADEMGM